jgi:type I restriction enzyme, S subunit
MELKRGYKVTDVGIIPDEWDVKKIGEVAPLQRGFDLPSSQLIKGTYPVVYSNGILNYHNKAIVKAPGIVTGRSGTLGKVNYLEKDYWPHNTTLWVTDFEGNFPRYVYYLFTYVKLEQFGTGSGVPTLNRNDVHAYKVPIPPLPEQRAIAEALSDVDALLAALDALIAKKRAIKQGAMHELLTGKTRLPGFSGVWKEKYLGDVTHSTAGGTPSTSIPEYWGGTIKWMSSGELHSKLVYDVVGRITEEGLRNSSTKIIPEKCVLIGLAGQGKTRGTVAMNMVELCTNQSIAAIFPSELFVPQYLFYNLNARYEELRSLSTGDGGRGGLNLHIINSLCVPFPSIAEQQAIATILSDIDTEIIALEHQRRKTRLIKQGMMQELLTGKTRLL